MIKMKMIKRICIFILLLVISFSLATCAAGPNVMKNAENPERAPAGFWKGLWHGLIAFVTFIISLFNKNVNIYEVYNNGGWYNFGFVLGVMIAFGGSGGAGSRMTCSTRKQKLVNEQEDSNFQ